LNSSTPGSMTVTTGDLANTSYVWDFDNEGNLTLPTGGNIYYANGTIYGGGGSSSIANGNSNVDIATANGNVTIAAVGNTTMTITGTGANITGTLNATGNITGANLVGVLANGNSNVTIATAAGNVVTNVNGSLGLTVAVTGIRVHGGTILSPGGASSITLNNNGANIPTAGITTVNTGLVQNGNSNVSITSNGNVILNAVGGARITATSTGANVTGTLTSTGKFGYASGSTVTQTTNRGNGVTINALAGTIVTVSATMVAGQIDTFSVANDQVDPNNDIVLVQIVSPNFGVYNCIAQPSSTISSFLNGFYVNIQNISGFTTTSDAITIRFMVIKAPNA
jgi:fibronectin-binding autotransporter adhesin